MNKPYYAYNWFLFKAIVKTIVLCYKVCYEKPQDDSVFCPENRHFSLNGQFASAGEHYELHNHGFFLDLVVDYIACRVYYL